MLLLLARIGSMSQALLAIGCLLLGIGVNEYIRRMNRIEAHAGIVFQRRLDLYERLWKMVANLNNEVGLYVDEPTVTWERVREDFGAKHSEIFTVLDEHALYATSRLTVQLLVYSATVKGMFEETDLEKRQSWGRGLQEEYGKLANIMREEAGIERIGELFQILTKSTKAADIFERELESK
jgi:hypothetical protein